MSVKAVLTIDGKKFNLLQGSYNFSRFTDASGYGTNIIRFDKINLLLPSYGDIFFLNWMFTPELQKSGSISYYEDEDMIRKIKRVVFAGAFCIGFKEVYHAASSMPMHTQLTISAGGVKIEESVFRFPWFKGPFKTETDEVLEEAVEYVGEEKPPQKVMEVSSKIPEVNDLSSESSKHGSQVLVNKDDIVSTVPTQNKYGKYEWNVIDSKTGAIIAEMEIRKNGFPVEDIHPHKAILPSGAIINLKANDFSFSRAVIDSLIITYNSIFKVDPENLPGCLKDDNLANFQKEYIKLKAQNENMNDQEALNLAVGTISWGKHRDDAGYGQFSVRVVELGEVILNGKKVKVPTAVDIQATLNPKKKDL